jgi:hypothetical protein
VCYNESILRRHKRGRHHIFTQNFKSLDFYIYSIFNLFIIEWNPLRASLLHPIRASLVHPITRSISTSSPSQTKALAQLVGERLGERQKNNNVTRPQENDTSLLHKITLSISITFLYICQTLNSFISNMRLIIVLQPNNRYG